MERLKINWNNQATNEQIGTIFQQLGNCQDDSLLFPHLKEIEFLNLKCQSFEQLLSAIASIDAFIKLYTSRDININSRFSLNAKAKTDIDDNEFKFTWDEISNILIRWYDKNKIGNSSPRQCSIDITARDELTSKIINSFVNYPSKHLQITKNYRGIKIDINMNKRPNFVTVTPKGEEELFKILEKLESFS